MVSPKQFWADRNVVPITGAWDGPHPPYLSIQICIYSPYIYIFIHIYTYINQEPINYSPQIISDGIAANIYPVVHFRPGECPDHSHEHPVHGLRGFCWLGGRCSAWTLHVAGPMWGKDSQTIGGLSDDETPLDSLVSHHFSHSKLAKNGSSSRKAPLSHGKYWAISPGL